MKATEIGVTLHGGNGGGTFRSSVRVKLDTGWECYAMGWSGTQELAADDAMLNLINLLFDRCEKRERHGKPKHT